MVKHFDHLTIVVRDTERAKAFFAVLGFKEAMSVVIAGEQEIVPKLKPADIGQYMIDRAQGSEKTE